MRSSIPALLLAALAALALPACSSLGPSDEPLPTFDELRARYGPQAPGTGTVQEVSGMRLSIRATHLTDGGGELALFYINLRSYNPVLRIGIYLPKIEGSQLRSGQDLEASFTYGGTGDGGRGGGKLHITAIEDGRISGVFAADIKPSGLYPDFRRIEGAFNAVPDSTR